MAEVESFDNAVVRMVEAASELGEGTVTAITVHVQDSGEFPYQIAVIEEQYPYAGVAIGQAVPEDNGRSLAAEPEPAEEPHE